jgi:AraC-like DNA-binding protein
MQFTDDHARLAANDWDEASHAVAAAYFAHRLRPAVSTTPAHVAVSGSRFGAVRIATIGWGALVDVETEHPGAVAVNVPRAGSLHSVIGQSDLVATPVTGTIYPADVPAVIRGWSPTCTITGIRFDRDFLRQEIARVEGMPRPLPVSVDLTTPAGASWYRLVHSLRKQRDLPQLVLDQLAGAVTDAFVLAVFPDTGGSAPTPRIVKRVIDRIEAEPDRAWTAGDMAEVAEVSVRRLQEGFRQYLGETPRAYLTRVRLQRSRDELKSGAGVSVADVALRWGFTHTSRFAADYHRAFGEYPSETLRRRD